MVAYLSLKDLANDRTAKLHHDDHGHAGFGSHQVQPLHSILPAVPAAAMGQDRRVDRSHRICCLLRRRHNHSVCIEQSVAGRVPSRKHPVMALPQVRTVLHPDRRHRHAGRLVPPNPPDPSRVDLTDIHREEAWRTDHIHDWGPVSFDTPSKRKTLSPRR